MPDLPAASLTYARWWRENDMPRCEMLIQRDGELTVAPIREGQAWNIIRELMEYVHASRQS